MVWLGKPYLKQSKLEVVLINYLSTRRSRHMSQHSGTELQQGFFYSIFVCDSRFSICKFLLSRKLLETSTLQFLVIFLDEITDCALSALASASRTISTFCLLVHKPESLTILLSWWTWGKTADYLLELSEQIIFSLLRAQGSDSLVRWLPAISAIRKDVFNAGAG